MSVAITCPNCRIALKANKTPRPDRLMQCLKCSCRFTMADVLDASAVAHSPAGANSRRPRVLFGSAMVAVLAVTGLFGSYLFSRPIDIPANPKAQTVAAIQVSLPVNFTGNAEQTDDVEFARRRQRFIQLMMDAASASELRKHQDAVAAYADALRIFPEDADALQKLAGARATLRAEEIARREIENAKIETIALLKRGQEAYDKGQFAAAIDLFKLALEKSPTNGEAAQRLSFAQKRMQAIDAEKKSLEEFDRRILTGKAALKARRPADAIREFLAAGNILPNDPLPGELVKEAELQLDNVKNQDDRKKQYQALLDEAAAFVRLKKFDDADESLRQALKLYPNDPVALRSLQDVQKGLKRAHAEVANLLNQAQNAVAATNLGAAMVFLRDAQAIAPNHPELRRALRAAELIQLNQAAYFQAINRAAASMALRRYGDALLGYYEALRLVPNDPLAMIGLLDAERGLAIINRKQLEYDVLVGQGVLLLQNQRYMEGARALEGAVRLVRPPLLPDPQVLSLTRYAEAMAQGFAALHARQFPLASQFFQRALFEAPTDSAAQLGLHKARLGVRI